MKFSNNSGTATKQHQQEVRDLGNLRITDNYGLQVLRSKSPFSEAILLCNFMQFFYAISVALFDVIFVARKLHLQISYRYKLVANLVRFGRSLSRDVAEVSNLMQLGGESQGIAANVAPKLHRNRR